jgi:hypothetical protein
MFRLDLPTVQDSTPPATMLAQEWHEGAALGKKEGSSDISGTRRAPPDHRESTDASSLFALCTAAGQRRGIGTSLWHACNSLEFPEEPEKRPAPA